MAFERKLYVYIVQERTDGSKAQFYKRAGCVSDGSVH